MASPTLLVHACCAQCLAAILDPLRRSGCWAAYFYNPNIQPLIEFRRRAKSLHVLAERERLALMADERYDVRGFLRTVPWDKPERCLACYRMRLQETARVAAEKGFSAMTTTLLASEHQDHEAVRRLGEEAAAGRGLVFHYEDWRALAGCGREEAKRRNLYRQQYCGCIFSEEERFAPTSLHLYGGGSAADRSGEGET